MLRNCKLGIKIGFSSQTISLMTLTKVSGSLNLPVKISCLRSALNGSAVERPLIRVLSVPAWRDQGIRLLALGQGKEKSGPVSHAALHAHCAAVIQDDVFHNCEA